MEPWATVRDPDGSEWGACQCLQPPTPGRITPRGFPWWSAYAHPLPLSHSPSHSLPHIPTPLILWSAEPSSPDVMLVWGARWVVAPGVPPAPEAGDLTLTYLASGIHSINSWDSWAVLVRDEG